MIRGNNARDFYIPRSILNKEQVEALQVIHQDYVVKEEK